MKAMLKNRHFFDTDLDIQQIKSMSTSEIRSELRELGLPPVSVLAEEVEKFLQETPSRYLRSYKGLRDWAQGLSYTYNLTRLDFVRLVGLLALAATLIIIAFRESPVKVNLASGKRTKPEKVSSESVSGRSRQLVERPDSLARVKPFRGHKSVNSEDWVNMSFTPLSFSLHSDEGTLVKTPSFNSPFIGASGPSYVIFPLRSLVTRRDWLDTPFVNRGNEGWTRLPDSIKRWDLEKALDTSSFNQMQRGAGPGAGIDDFGLVTFADGRLSEHVNTSVNRGYILNSKPKTDPMGDAVLLDQPDEFLAGLGFDFPNRWRLEVDHEAPSKLRPFPKHLWGRAVGHRRQLNQVGVGLAPFTPPPGAVQVFGFPYPRKNQDAHEPSSNRPPTVAVSASRNLIIKSCPNETGSSKGISSISLRAIASDPDNDPLLYSWSVSVGKIEGERLAVWDLGEAKAGMYFAKLQVDDGNNHNLIKTVAVVVTSQECDRELP